MLLCCTRFNLYSSIRGNGEKHNTEKTLCLIRLLAVNYGSISSVIQQLGSQLEPRQGINTNNNLSHVPALRSATGKQSERERKEIGGDGRGGRGTRSMITIVINRITLNRAGWRGVIVPLVHRHDTWQTTGANDRSPAIHSNVFLWGHICFQIRQR